MCPKICKNRKKFGITNIILSSIKNNLKIKYQDFSDILWLDVDDNSMYDELKRNFNGDLNNYPFGLKCAIN